MNKRKFILLMAALCTMTTVCWGQSYWKRTYGGTFNDAAANAITPTSDGNFIIAGYTNYLSYLLKINPNGDTLWTKTYDDTNGKANAIIPTSDGDFIVAGTTGSLGYNSKVFLLKIKPNGDKLWTRTYGGTSDCCAQTITITSDGNFIISGSTFLHDEVREDLYLLKVKPNGDILWTKTYGGTNGGLAQKIMPTSDGNFIIAGYTYNSQIYLLKINPNGDTLWTKTYGEFGGRFAQTITTTSDGNFIVAGIESPSGSEVWNVYLLKIKPNGDTLWTKTYKETENYEVYAIESTSDGNFIVGGAITSYGAGTGVVYLMKIKPNGDTLWTKTYAGIGYQVAYAITPTLDGNFIAAGVTSDNKWGAWEDVYLLSIIDDRYTKKDSLFTFKIPVSGDSRSNVYFPLKAPSGMTVSLGGTISWTPKTDSVYMDHVEFLVADDYGKKDTLTFNIFVNSSYHPTAIKPMSHSIAKNNQTFRISQASASQIKFSLPTDASNIDIYDINGRCVQRLKPADAQAVWNGLNSAGRPLSSGRYFAKIKDGASSRMAEFSVVK
jgi:hypothetical protein